MVLVMRMVAKYQSRIRTGTLIGVDSVPATLGIMAILITSFQQIQDAQ